MPNGPVLRRYTFKLYCNRSQEQALERMRALHSNLYNALIQQRIEAWSRQRKSLSYFDQRRELTVLRAGDPEYAALAAKSMEETAKRVDLAFQAFFRRVKAARKLRKVRKVREASADAKKKKKPPKLGFPHYKRCEGFGFGGFGGWSFDGSRLYLKSVPGRIRARGKFPAQPLAIKVCSVTFREGAWWLSVACEMPPRMRQDADQSGEVNFNLVDSFARVRRVDGGCPAGPEETVYAAADGRIILPNEGACRHLVAVAPQTGGDDRAALGAGAPQNGMMTRIDDVAADRIAWLQQRMSRCKFRSHKYRALRLRKARCQARAARGRRETLHLWTTQLARRHASLRIIGPPLPEATESGAGDEQEWGAMVEEKADFNRRVLDQGSGGAIRMLLYKLRERDGSAEVIEDAEAPAMIGNEMVEAKRAIRSLRRAARHAQ